MAGNQEVDKLNQEQHKCYVCKEPVDITNSTVVEFEYSGARYYLHKECFDVFKVTLKLKGLW